MAPSLELYSEAGQLTEAFTTACSGLVELSSMPKYNTSKRKSREVKEEEGEEQDGRLPSWLLGLVLCSTLQKVNASSFAKDIILLRGSSPILIKGFSALSNHENRARQGDF